MHALRFLKSKSQCANILLGAEVALLLERGLLLLAELLVNLGTLAGLVAVVLSLWYC